MSSKLQRAIFATIIYADIFDYPLKIEEVGKWLIRVKSEKFRPKADQPRAEKVNSEIRKLKIIKEKDDYYFLKGRYSIVEERKRREKHSQEKFKIAKKIASLLQLIPSIKLVGVTGALAVDNAKENDDIDLFIVSSKGLLWTTRFLATFLIELSGKRRHPGEAAINNKICLNMFVDEDHLEIPNKEKDLFSAHEVLQMKPIFDRGKTYKKFLEENYWVKRYLPNAIDIKNQRSKIKTTDQKSNIFYSFLIFICRFAFYFLHFAFAENPFKEFQLWYMHNRRTSEVIKDGIIRFHPQDAREWVMSKYYKRLKQVLDNCITV